MERLVIAGVLAVVAVVVALVIQKRTTPPPVRTRYPVPTHVDRRDFERPDAAWLVAVFSSATCLSCKGTWEKARQLESEAVAVDDVEVSARREIHQRYGIEAVPCVVVADRDGAVQASFLGEPTATDLWAVVAELREPGSTPATCDHHQSAP